MKICLATLHCNPRFTPLALLYLKAYLVEREGHEPDDVAILEFTQDSRLDDMVRQILDSEPAIVGLSCYVWNIQKLTAVSRRIKELRPGLKVVLGGPEVGPIAKSVLEAHSHIDVIVASEGEVPFSELVAAWRDGSEIDGILGVCFRRGRDIVDSGEAPLLRDLNRLPSPHTARYGSHTGRFICLETQRGCVFRCSFCFYNKDLSVRNRRFDLERVKQEILFWLEKDVGEIYLMDPVFNLNVERAKEICRFIGQHNRQNVRFHAEVWAEFIDEELAPLLKAANFRFLEVGLQTTDEAALATVERRLRLKQFLDGIERLKRFGLKFELQLIFGLPGETMASFRKSLNFASSLDPDTLAVFPLMVLPGTELWRQAQALKLAFDPEPPYIVRSHFSMTSSEIEYGWKILDALERLGNSRTFRLLCREPGVTLADVVDEWIAWQQARPEPSSVEEEVGAFLSRFCGQRAIPAAFYRGFSTLEFRE